MTVQNPNALSEGGAKDEVDVNSASNGVIAKFEEQIKELQKKVDSQNAKLNARAVHQEGGEKSLNEANEENFGGVNKVDLKDVVQQALEDAKKSDKLNEVRSNLSGMELYAFNGMLDDGKTADEAMEFIKQSNTSEPKTVGTNTNNTITTEVPEDVEKAYNDAKSKHDSRVRNYF